MGALSLSVLMANMVPDMEAVACRHAVNFAAELGLQRLIFGDSAIVINAVSQGNAALASYGNIMEDI